MGAVIVAFTLASLAFADEGARDKGLGPSLTTAEALSQALAPKRYALLVGVDAYEDPAFPALRHAGADATALGDAFRRATGGGFDEVRVLVGASTDREAFVGGLVELRAKIRREDSVVVYFSGHGTRVLDEGRWRRFLLLADSRSADLDGTAVDLADLQVFFSSLPAARKALIVDSCFSGDGKSVARPDTLGAERTAPPMEPLVPKIYTLGPGEAQMFATTNGRPSREDDKLGHGVYTYYLLEALSWGFQEADLDVDRVVTVFEAHDYARSRTMTHTAGVQVPEAAFRVVGEADLVLAGDVAARRTREQALVYLYADRSPYSGARVLVDGRDRGVFPGTVPLDPGLRHVRLEAADGSSLAEGYARISADQHLRADDLARLIQGPQQMAGLQIVAAGAAPLATVLGQGAVGGELYSVWRSDQGATRGWYGESFVGAAHAERPIGDGTTDGRGVGWVGGATGWQGDRGSLRLRAGVGASVTVAPPDREAEASEDAERGWWWAAAGPTASVGYVVRGGMSVRVGARTHFAALDLDADGHTAWVPWTSAHTGLEMAW